MNADPATQEFFRQSEQVPDEPLSDGDLSSGLLARNLDFNREVLEVQFTYRRSGDDYREPTATEKTLIRSYVAMLSEIERSTGVFKNGETIELVDARIKSIAPDTEQLFALLKVSDGQGNYLVRSSDLELKGHLLSTGSLPAMVEVYSDLDTIKRSVAALQDSADTIDPELVWQYRMIYSPLALSHECRVLSSDEFVHSVLSQDSEASSFVLYQTLRAAMREVNIQTNDLDLANLNDDVSVRQVRLDPMTASEFQVHFPKQNKEVRVAASLRTGNSREETANREQLGILYFNRAPGSQAS